MTQTEIVKLTTRLKVKNALAAAGARTPEAADLFIARHAAKLKLNEWTDELTLDGVPIESAMLADSSLSAPYKNPSIVTMGEAQFKEAYRAGVQFPGGLASVQLVSDPPATQRTASDGKTLMSREEYKSAMMEGVQGLADVELSD